MFALLDAASPASSVVRTSWMRQESLKLPPGRHVALAPGVHTFHPHKVYPVSVLDGNASLPAPEIEPSWRRLAAPDWHEWSLCNGMDQEAFFSEDRQKRVTLAKQAKIICKACPVAQECLTWALDKGEEYGIWAGTSGRQRESMQDRIAKGESSLAGEVEAWLLIKKKP